MRGNSVFDQVDWLTITIYFIMVTLGWFSIYAAVYDEENADLLVTLSYNPGKQLVWIGSAMILIVGVMSLDFKFYDYSAYIIYGLMIALLIAVLTTGTVVAGSKSWFQIGSFRLQPAEFTKFATALALAKYLGDIHVKFDKPRTQLPSCLCPWSLFMNKETLALRWFLERWSLCFIVKDCLRYISYLVLASSCCLL